MSFSAIVDILYVVDLLYYTRINGYWGFRQHINKPIAGVGDNVEVIPEYQMV